MELASKYNPAEVEGKWYQYWLDNKLFSSKPDGRELCAFVKIDASEADEVLGKYGCRTLASFGDIRIATISVDLDGEWRC